MPTYKDVKSKDLQSVIQLIENGHLNLSKFYQG
ncbi:hypothetical protein RCO48_04440 [Peribacillus frigoritolerans]|nr:hypothetical protein [Peribacillus frigoritolerans]